MEEILELVDLMESINNYSIEIDHTIDEKRRILLIDSNNNFHFIVSFNGLVIRHIVMMVIE